MRMDSPKLGKTCRRKEWLINGGRGGERDNKLAKGNSHLLITPTFEPDDTCMGTEIIRNSVFIYWQNCMDKAGEVCTDKVIDKADYILQY